LNKVEFYKYQGTGNDFIIIDDRKEYFNLENVRKVRNLCDRKFGIGADGLILIRKHPVMDFTMIYYNPDGSKSFCGNGSRCAVQFVYDTGMFTKNEFSFEAIDGNHIGYIESGWVCISVNDLRECKKVDGDYFLHTGSPHYIRYVNKISEVDVLNEGKKIRYSDSFKPDGTNVNFVEVEKDHIKVRTYERGVENETLSCGSGVTASALSAVLKENLSSPVTVKTPGGILSVSFKRSGNDFSEIFLAGPAKFVFKGEFQKGAFDV
jgi:diaminopimelate epimerase